ncbi:hypothetical protein AAKU64_001484 [Undibacterium sp. GrIS 1.8]
MICTITHSCFKNLLKLCSYLSATLTYLRIFLQINVVARFDQDCRYVRWRTEFLKVKAYKKALSICNLFTYALHSLMVNSA